MSSDTNYYKQLYFLDLIYIFTNNIDKQLNNGTCDYCWLSKFTICTAKIAVLMMNHGDVLEVHN